MKKLYRAKNWTKIQQNKRALKQVPCKDYHPTHYRRRKMHELSTDDKIAIINSVIVDKESHLEAARIHKVILSIVRFLVKKVKKNTEYVKELLMIDL